MENPKKGDILSYLSVLRNGKTDNEKFAALLMVAKKGKDKSCDLMLKREILDAIGGKFFTRLLKSNNVPKDCAPYIFKSVAMSILSALCNEPDSATSTVLTDNLSSFNNIVLLKARDEEEKQLVDDTYDCFNSLCQSNVGLECLLKAESVSALCQAVILQNYGFEKANELICRICSCYGPDIWSGCQPDYHSFVNFLAQQFMQDKTMNKYELSKTLVILLSAAPKDEEEAEDPPWIMPIVNGLYDILRSKLDASQRESALKLAAVMVQVCGIHSLQPPYLPDFKLFLLTAHMCCIEVRMVLEDGKIKLAAEKEDCLLSCYTLLEHVISYLSSDDTVTIEIEGRQLLQLQTALIGAFNGVLHFLKQVSIDRNAQWDSTVLATIRVLGAWLAEETSALRKETLEIIPFLIQISKFYILPPSCKEMTKYPNPLNKGDVYNGGKQNEETCESVSNKDLNRVEHFNGDTEKTPCDPHEDLKKMKSLGLSENNDVNKCVESNTSDGEKIYRSTDGQGSENKTVCEQSTIKNMPGANNEHLVNKGQVLDGKENSSTATAEECSGVENATGVYESRLEKESKLEKGTKLRKGSKSGKETKLGKESLSDVELRDLHENFDVLQFLLPALCHQTAEEDSRQIFLKCGGLKVLDLYMRRKWKELVDQKNPIETEGSLVVLCNIFLNIIIEEPTIVQGSREFSDILVLVTKGVQLFEKETEHIVLWSHLITLGLMLLRTLNSTLEKDSRNQFFKSSIHFMSGIYTVKHEKGQSTLDVVDTYRPAWEEVSQTWFLSMQALSNCVPLYPDLPEIILQTGWLPRLLSMLSKVKVKGIPEETRSCFLSLLTAVAGVSKSAKSVICENGGLDIARLFKSPGLAEILNSS